MKASRKQSRNVRNVNSVRAESTMTEMTTEPCLVRQGWNKLHVYIVKLESRLSNET